MCRQTQFPAILFSDSSKGREIWFIHGAWGLQAPSPCEILSTPGRKSEIGEGQIGVKPDLSRPALLDHNPQPSASSSHKSLFQARLWHQICQLYTFTMISQCPKTWEGFWETMSVRVSSVPSGSIASLWKPSGRWASWENLCENQVDIQSLSCREQKRLWEPERSSEAFSGRSTLCFCVRFAAKLFNGFLIIWKNPQWRF